MTVGELITAVRYDLNDTQKIEYSDAELIEYINRAQEWINQELIELGSHLVVKKASLELTNSTAPLPADFVKEYAVVARGNVLESIPPSDALRDYTYKIYGSRIEAKADTVDLYYFYAFPKYASANDVIVLPDVLMNILKYLTVLLAKNRIEVPAKLEASLIQDLRKKLQSYAELGLTSISAVAPFRI